MQYLKKIENAPKKVSFLSLVNIGPDKRMSQDRLFSLSGRTVEVLTMQNWERFLITVLGDRYKPPAKARDEPEKRSVGQKPKKDRKN